MTSVAITAYLTYHALGFSSWFIRRPTWAMLLPSARPLRDWGRLWLVYVLAGFFSAFLAAPFDFSVEESTAPIFVNVHLDADILEAFLDPTMEEVSRFGLWFALLGLAPHLPRGLVAGTVSVWFSLLHSYHIDMAYGYSAYWPFYVLAFGMSFILFAVGFRYGMLVTLILHVLFNTFRAAVSFALPGSWIWLNWLLGVLCFAAIFWVLRRVPIKPVFAEAAVPADRQAAQFGEARDPTLTSARGTDDQR